MTVISAFAQQLSDLWAMHYFLLIILAIVLALSLARVTQGMMRFTGFMLALFVAFLIVSAACSVVGAVGIAKVLATMAVLVLGLLLIRQLGLLMFRRVIPKLGFTPPRILEELIILLAYIVWGLIRLSDAGLNPSSLVASTAAVTAILAFAMQDTLGNILAGLALQLDHSIRIGDWIEIDDIYGKVDQVQWRHTAIRTLFGEKILVPNSHLMKTRVSIVGGNSVPKRRRSVYFYSDFSVSSLDVIPAVETAINQARIPGVSHRDRAVCQIHDFSEGVIVYALRYWLIDATRPGGADSSVRQHIHTLFQRKGWHMAAPRRAINMVSREAYRAQITTAHHHKQAEIISALKKVSLFSPLKDDEVAQLAARLRTVPYAAGSTLTVQGEVGDTLFITVSGNASVWLETGEHRHRVADIGPGEVIGEMSLLTGEPRRATVSAATDLICYELGKADFQMILDQRPALADAFASLLAQRNRELQETQSQPTPAAQQQEKEAILRRITRWFS